MLTLSNIDLVERAGNVRLLVLDVDGVLTDGKLYFLADGSEAKAFSTLDGQGIGINTRKRLLIDAPTLALSPNRYITKQGLDIELRGLEEHRLSAALAMVIEHPGNALPVLKEVLLQ